MKIYTRTGDDGTTGLFGGGRVRKSHPRISCYGTVDEANAAIGVVRAHLTDSAPDRAADARLAQVQHDLFVLGGDLASPGNQKYPVPRIDDGHVAPLERAIDELEADIPPLAHFILPGGTPAGAALHVARTVCRRAERLLIELADTEDVAPAGIHYLNRLSDFLFVLARWVNHQAGAPEQAWVPVQRNAGGREASGPAGA